LHEFIAFHEVLTVLVLVFLLVEELLLVVEDEGFRVLEQQGRDVSDVSAQHFSQFIRKFDFFV